MTVSLFIIVDIQKNLINQSNKHVPGNVVQLQYDCDQNCVIKIGANLFEAGLRLVFLAAACVSHVGTHCHNVSLLVLRRLIGTN